jgi:hypothetical protein
MMSDWLIIAFPNPHIVTTEHLFAYLVVRALNADRDVSEPACLEGVDGAAADGAEAEYDRLSLVAVVPVDTLELKGMQDPTVPRQFVVLVEGVAADLSVGTPDEHVFEGDECQFAIDRSLRDSALLCAMGIAPKNPTFAELLKISHYGLGNDDPPQISQ